MGFFLKYLTYYGTPKIKQITSATDELNFLENVINPKQTYY